MPWLADRRFVAGLSLGVFFLAVYLLSGSSDLLNNGDTDLRYQTTQAIIDHHRLWIAHPMYLDTRVALGRGHHLYAFYAPGQATLMIPFYVAGRFIAHHWNLPYDVTTLYASRSLDLFLGAALVIAYFLMALAIGYSLRTSVILSLVFGLATPAWPDAQSALEQTQVDLFLLLAVLLLWMFARSGLSRRLWLVAAGCAIGLAVFTRYDAALYVPVLVVYPAVLRWRTGDRSRILSDWLAFASGLSPWVLAVLAWDWARFGSPFLTGLHEATLGEPPWLGFLGLTVSPGKGILWYLPLVFLLPWALPLFVRRRPDLGWLFVLLAVLPLVFYSNVLYWHGDPAWGPRYLYTSLPYLVLPLGVLLEGWRTVPSPVRLFALALVAISLVLDISAVSVTQWRFWYRLEAAEARTSQPFKWGARYYHYYWNPGQSALLIQVDDVYQIVRIALGDQRYRWTARPMPCEPPPPGCHPSNPADNYPINTASFWWADTRHPLFGDKTRYAIAGLLGAIGAATLVLLFVRLGAQESPLLEDRARVAAMARTP